MQSSADNGVPDFLIEISKAGKTGVAAWDTIPWYQ
jgi:hypothetical protein